MANLQFPAENPVLIARLRDVDAHNIVWSEIPHWHYHSWKDYLPPATNHSPREPTLIARISAVVCAFACVDSWSKSPIFGRRAQYITILVSSFIVAYEIISRIRIRSLSSLREPDTATLVASKTSFLKKQVDNCDVKNVSTALHVLLVLNLRHMDMFSHSHRHDLRGLTQSLLESSQVPLKELCWKLATECALQGNLLALDVIPAIQDDDQKKCIDPDDNPRKAWLANVQKTCDERLQPLIGIIMEASQANSSWPKEISLMIVSYVSDIRWPKIQSIVTRVINDWTSDLAKVRANARDCSSAVTVLDGLMKQNKHCPKEVSCVTVWAWEQLHPGQRLLTQEAPGTDSEHT